MGECSYTPEIGDKICEAIATSADGLRTICKREGMPAVRTVLNWLAQGSKEDSSKELQAFLHQYAHAREAQADFLVEEMLSIADDGNSDLTETEEGTTVNNEVIQRSRLRVDTRKWIASKLRPKKYGDKLDLTSDNEKLNTLLNVSIVQPKDDD
jgi:hypothetical protein